MSKVHVVLLVPAEGDPHGLLADGPCGARSAQGGGGSVGRARDHTGVAPRGCGVGHPDTWQSHSEFVRRGECYMCDFPEEALVLFWDGKLVPEGMDRAARVDPHYRSEAWASARALGQEMERLKYGTFVLLDTEGREVTP